MRKDFFILLSLSLFISCHFLFAKIVSAESWDYTKEQLLNEGNDHEQ